MSDALIYPCLVHLMRIIDSKERDNSQMKPFYHARLLVKHFIGAKQMFNMKPQVYKSLLKYYYERCVLQEQSQYEDTDSYRFVRQVQKLTQTQKDVCQIILRVIIIGIQANLNIEINKTQREKIHKICQRLHLNLVLQGQSISDIILKFLQKITQEIKNLPFYEYLLKIFVRLDYLLIISHIQRSIQKYREEWNQNQKQSQQAISRKSLKRQTLFMPKQNQLNSFEQKQKVKNSQTVKTASKSLAKLQQKEIQKRSINKMKTIPKIQQSNRRRTVYNDNRYKFVSRKSELTSLFENSLENTNLGHKNMEQTKNLKTFQTQVVNKSYLYQTSERQVRVSQIQEDILVENTPQKKKRM